MKGWHKALLTVGGAIGSGALIAAALLRPWYLRWGATDNELKKSWPGDELVQRPGQCTRGITIHAPAERIWPWIMQIGQDRGGFYSYAWLENLFLANMRNADRIVPVLQPREVGDVVWMAPEHRYGGRACMAVVQLAPGAAMVLVQRDDFAPAIRGERVHGGIWQFFVEPIDAKRSRLIMRGAAPDETSSRYDIVFDPVHFIMERKMMLGIKERVDGMSIWQTARDEGGHDSRFATKHCAMTGHTTDKMSGRSKPPRRLPPIRFSAVDCRIIASGMDWIDANYRTWSTKGRMPYAHPELRWLPKSFDRGRYNAEFMEQVLAAGKAINHIYDHGGRLYDFTMFQVAALILALRIVTQNVRHEHFKSLVKDLPRRSKRLIKKLEKHRKRAKRACIVAVGAEQCRAQQTEWQAFVRWLRIHFCQCACLVRHKHPRIALLRKRVTTFVEWARAELLDRRDPVPPEPELRRLVRQAMRYVQRGRKGYTLRHLENDKVHASAYFCNYVTLALEKQQRKKTMRAR